MYSFTRYLSFPLKIDLFIVIIKKNLLKIYQQLQTNTLITTTNNLLEPQVQRLNKNLTDHHFRSNDIL